MFSVSVYVCQSANFTTDRTTYNDTISYQKIVTYIKSKNPHGICRQFNFFNSRCTISLSAIEEIKMK